MQNQPKNKKIIILVVVVILLGLGYMLLNNSAPDSGTTIVVQNQSTAVGSDLLPLLLQLNALHLDDSIFKDQSFKTLQDYTIDIGSQPIGRSNPFAPLPKTSVAGTTTAATKLPPIKLPAKK